MSFSVESLRTFVIEQLTVAADEIIRVFQQKIDEYEDQMDYQRRVVESVWRPEVKLHRIEFSQPPLSQEEGVPTHQHQDGSCSLEQEDSEPPPVKEEKAEPWCHQDRERLTVKQESNALMVTPIHKEDDQETSVSPESDCDLQLLSHSPHVAESKDQGNDKGEEPKPTVKQNKRKRRPGNANNPAESAVDWNTDTGATPASCHTGEEQVKVTSDLTGHSPINASDNPDTHSACGIGSRRSRLSSLRTKNHTGEKIFVCKTCGETFNRIHLLKVHRKGHGGERPYMCTTCKKPFIYYANLERHMNYHSGKTPCLCKTCGKTFRRSSDLTVHRRVHTGERPYVCKTCGKAFKQISALNAHIILHTGQRPYICKTCGKAFKQNSTLSAHVKLHTSERSYVCKTCGKSFKQNSTLNAHMKLHTGGKPCVCKTWGHLQTDEFTAPHETLHM